LALLDQGPDLSANNTISVINEFIKFTVEKKLGDSNRQNAKAAQQLLESLVCSLVSTTLGVPCWHLLIRSLL